MSCSFRWCLVTALTSVIAGSAMAAPPQSDIARAIRESFGTQLVDGHVVGGGPEYRTVVTPTTFEFTPAFGSAADRTYPWAYALTSIERADGTVLWTADSAFDASLPSVDGARASIARGSNVVEIYDHRVDGVEQSFALAARPAGSGDLVVRGRISTDLSMPPSGRFDDGVEFTAQGLGAIRLGRVLGVDANGVQVPGSIRIEGTMLEYALPASFVDGAAYPMVLDPVIATATSVASGFDEEDADAAFEASFNTWCVVWRRVFSNGDSDVRAQRIDTNGNFVGSLLLVDSSSGVGAITPRVANVTRNEDFVVVWGETSGFLNSVIKARVIKATTGAMSSKLDVGPTTGLNIECDVSGEYLELYSHATVVWRQYDTAASQWQIVAARIGLPDAAPPLAFGQFVVASGFEDSQPSISQTGGQFGLSMVAWKRTFTDDTVEIRGAIVSRAGVVVDPFIAVTNSTGIENAPSVDGDGHNFAVAYETQAVAGAPSDVFVQRVSVVPGGQWAPVGSVFAIGLISPDALKQPSVAWMGGSVVGAYRQQVGTHFESRLFAYDPFALQTFESTVANPIAQAGVHDESVRVSWGADDYAVAVVEREAVAGTGSVLAYRHVSVDGIQQSLGNNCGGRAYAMGAKVGNPNFRLQLTAADPLAPTYLILSASAVNVPCGACTLVANPSQGLLLALGNTDVNGEFAWVTGIPNNPAYVGLPFITQWFTIDNVSPGCPSLGVNFSSTLKTTLQ